MYSIRVCNVQWSLGHRLAPIWEWHLIVLLVSMQIRRKFKTKKFEMPNERDLLGNSLWETDLSGTPVTRSWLDASLRADSLHNWKLVDFWINIQSRKSSTAATNKVTKQSNANHLKIFWQLFKSKLLKLKSCPNNGLKTEAKGESKAN